VKEIVIAFDCDGTLLKTTDQRTIAPADHIRTLLITMSQFKNTKIVVWSGGGAGYARRVAEALGVAEYVDDYAGKNPQRPVGVTETATRGVFQPDIEPDIAIDDIEDCDLGVLNLIVG
jgi:hypothetical protein